MLLLKFCTFILWAANIDVYFLIANFLFVFYAICAKLPVKDRKTQRKLPIKLNDIGYNQKNSYICPAKLGKRGTGRQGNKVLDARHKDNLKI